MNILCNERWLRILWVGIFLLPLCAGCTPRGAASVEDAPANAAPPPAATSALPRETDETAPAQDTALTAPPTLAETQALNLLLGRPTDHSLAISLLAAQDRQVVLSYHAVGDASPQTLSVALQAGQPQTLELSGLAADSEYRYQVSTDGLPTREHHFHTQRPPGSSFTFTIDADPHGGDPNFNGELYATTLGNAWLDQPDFHIDLGDTFMTEKLKVRSASQAEDTYSVLRPYFGILAGDAPLFLVNGNHEGELGWLLGGKSGELPLWSTRLRQQYYPGPLPGEFYSGASASDPALQEVRDGYYAWSWGDALFVVLDPFWNTTRKPHPTDPDSNWNWTLGKAQYDWLQATLRGSPAKYKFIFIHHLVGGSNTDARGGVEAAPYFEWGGKNADGSQGFAAQRPGWEQPIHALLVETGVSAVFHGHDHVYVQQELDGILYQELPQPSMARYDNTALAAEYGYTNGVVRGSSGHLRVTVTPTQVTVSYIRAYLSRDETAQQVNGMQDVSYSIFP